MRPIYGSLILLVLVLMALTEKAIEPRTSLPPQSSARVLETEGGGADAEERITGKSAGWHGPEVPSAFGANVSASLNDPETQNETSIAIDPGNNGIVIIGANDYRNLTPWIYRSTDGGTSWVNFQPPVIQQDVYYGDPTVAFGAPGHVYYGIMGSRATGETCDGTGGIYVLHSTAAGAEGTFSLPAEITSNSNDGQIAIYNDKPYLAADSAGNVVVSWTKYAMRVGSDCGTWGSLITAPIMAAHSTDSGIHWSEPITVTAPLSSANTFGAVPLVRNGKVYVYYLSGGFATNYDTIMLARSTDGGVTFPDTHRIASLTPIPNPMPPTGFRTFSAGALALDPAGRLVAVWADYANGDADILVSRSVDDGDTWGVPIRVNDDSLSNGKDQFFPWIAAGDDGRIHVAWSDRRNSLDNTSYEEWYSYSIDGGASWVANTRVSTAPSPPGTLNFIGDYTGLAATSGVVMAAWTDIRSGQQDAYVARNVYGPTTPTLTGTVTPPTRTVTSSLTHTRTPTLTRTPTHISTATQTGVATFTATATTTPIPFTDMHPTDYFYMPVQYLAAHGILSGYDNGDGTFSFRPYSNTTRGQLTKIIVRGQGWPTDTTGGPHFADVLATHPFYDMIETAYHRGIISGYDNGDGTFSFRPGADVTRGQIAKIVVTAAGWTTISPAMATFRDVPVGAPFYSFVETAACRQVISGYDNVDGTFNFRPGNNATRGQIAKIVYNALTSASMSCGSMQK